jgi:hypothetical protein
MTLQGHEELRRCRYFTGHLLQADDFTTEQAYFVEKHRRHNRYLHGWGVVRGFEVSVLGSDVVVRPGVAIDCAGNELHLDNQVRIQVPKKGRAAYVVAEYREIENSPVPRPSSSDPAGGDLSGTSYARIEEACEVSLTTKDPASGHYGMGPGTPGCGHQHPVPIARLQRRTADWAATRCGQR